MSIISFNIDVMPPKTLLKLNKKDLTFWKSTDKNAQVLWELNSGIEAVE
jgi:hypothetical protein